MALVQEPSRLIAVLWVLLTLLVAGLAASEVNRVARGELFLWRFHFDASPTIAERHDARESAASYRVAAVCAVLCCSGLLMGMHRLSMDRERPATLFVVVFLLATAFDLFTTLWFFHEDGIDSEIHPGVRLLGYAYGRTAGPMLAKLVQAIGILWLASRLPKIANVLLAGTAGVYLLAALYNLLA